MIKSKADYEYYIEADRIALSVKRKKPRLFGDEIWKFQRFLRKVEYLENCKKGRLSTIKLYYARFRLSRLSIALGFSIPPNVFGPGLSISHRGPIVVAKTKVGKNCRISHCVTIGVNVGNNVPVIGDNVFIGPGAVIVGPIKIANGVAIGANSFVNKSFNEPEITIAGVPAVKISNEGSEKLHHRATEILSVVNKKSA